MGYCFYAPEILQKLWHLDDPIRDRYEEYRKNTVAKAKVHTFSSGDVRIIYNNSPISITPDDHELPALRDFYEAMGRHALHRTTVDKRQMLGYIGPWFAEMNQHRGGYHSSVLKRYSNYELIEGIHTNIEKVKVHGSSLYLMHLSPTGNDATTHVILPFAPEDTVPLNIGVLAVSLLQNPRDMDALVQQLFPQYVGGE